MSQSNETPRAPRSSDGDRRGNERRRVERRAPVPVWRRPWAFAGYGVAAALLGVFLFGGGGGGENARPSNDAPMVTRAPGGPAVPLPDTGAAATPATTGAAEAAFGAAGYERLVLQGAAARGRMVRAELYCEQPTSYQVRTNVTAEPVVAALTDNGRIPAAACKWGGANDPRREDFLLLVPKELAGVFSSAPVTSDEFQRRRRMVATVEWVGPSEALSLRTAGVFRGMAR
ncbi:MAG: hypothetical protein AVDCRST_MAG68-4173 [uncultured Gemmatimonadetes bacterium]|uniref:Uncharacterized protein n=1 Tax=uncultured Gemmatimonadota bacterium TaxID=203437 RepID=A0A6J4MFM1_9BACT|nr:MAG: hypothetical protein AVDCRST_MAG68-4173 [uncultured Gemmatimonadota bacterium]